MQITAERRCLLAFAGWAKVAFGSLICDFPSVSRPGIHPRKDGMGKAGHSALPEGILEQGSAFWGGGNGESLEPLYQTDSLPGC